MNIRNNLEGIFFKSCFGLAFDDAAERTKSRVNFCFLDNSSKMMGPVKINEIHGLYFCFIKIFIKIVLAIEINTEDKSKFLDALVAVMQ